MSDKPKVLYVAGPYRAKTWLGVARNIWRARRAAQQLSDKGYYVLCPHMNTAFMTGKDEHFLDMTAELMRRCDGVALLPGWVESKGCLAEYSEATAMGLPCALLEIWL